MMKVTIKIEEDSLLRLANGNFHEILQLPEEVLLAPINLYNRNALQILAQRGNRKILDYPHLLKNKHKGIELLVDLLEYLHKDEDLDKFVSIVGFDQLHLHQGRRGRTLLHILGEKGYVKILDHEGTFTIEDNNKHLPVFNLYQYADAVHLEKLFKHPKCLQSLNCNLEAYCSNMDDRPLAKYPLYHMSMNRHRPTVKLLKKYFKFESKYSGNKRLDIYVLREIISGSKALRFIFTN